MRWFEKIGINKYSGILIVTVVLLISGIAHGWNMFGFPYFENDEGVYVSQGWSAFNLGKLSPYTYWYDHAPAGWILIGLWQRLTGGVFTFGMAAASGRVLMLVLHVGMTFGLLHLGKKITGNWAAGVLAAIVFSLSPLAIYYQRRVLLDNIATFWVIVSLTILINKPLKIWPVALAALIAGVAVLSKEVAIFFTPGWLYAIWVNSRKNRAFVLAVFLTIFLFTISTYFLFAWLKGELLPYGFGGDTTQRVSLTDTVRQQLGRGVEFPFWDTRSLFYQNWKDWLIKDPVLTWGMAVTLIAGGFLSIWRKKIRIPVILAWCFAIFLSRSKLIIDFYLLPLIPFAALVYGTLVSEMSTWVKNERLRNRLITAAIIITTVVIGFRDIGQFNKNENLALSQSVEFLKKTAQKDDLIVSDSSIYLDLKLARKPGDKAFENVHWAWKIEEDKQIREEVMKNDWRNIKYLAVSHEMMKQIRDFDAETIKIAVDNSTTLAMYIDGSSAYLDLPKYISTNGDWMGILKIKDAVSIVLDNSWNYYRSNFIHSYGQVIDPQTGNTTSEGQAYGMLRAVWADDRKTFDGLWAWTRDHMQYRADDKLFSWLWVKEGDSYVLGDFTSAADADVDIALALLEAGKRWGEEKYITSAREIIQSIWEKEVVKINNTHYLVSGSDAKRKSGYLINPSYFSPAAYKIFAQIDSDNDWLRLADETYGTWKRIEEMQGNRSGLMPNWLWIDEVTEGFAIADEYLGRNSFEYGYDAFRAYFRAAIDLKWNKENKAEIFLKNSGEWFLSEWKTKQKIAAEYDLSGNALVENESLSTLTGAIFAVSEFDKQAGEEIFELRYDRTDEPDFPGFWGDRNNYYEQNWSWLTTALYKGRLINYW